MRLERSVPEGRQCDAKWPRPRPEVSLSQCLSLAKTVSRDRAPGRELAGTSVGPGRSDRITRSRVLLAAESVEDEPTERIGANRVST